MGGNRLLDLRTGTLRSYKLEVNKRLPKRVKPMDKNLSEMLGKGEIVRSNIVAYTDRLGSDEYNIELSKLRANTIKNYLASKGIPSDKIVTAGLGENHPVVQCKQEQRNKFLVNCFQPNRRFEIEIETLKKVSLKE